MNKFDHTKPFTTRDGRPARILGEIRHQIYPLAVAILQPEGDELTATYTRGGRICQGEIDERPSDLVNTPQPFRFERWVNVYTQPAGDEDCVGELHIRKEDADACGKEYTNRIACVKVIIEGKEGDGL